MLVWDDISLGRNRRRRVVGIAWFLLGRAPSIVEIIQSCKRVNLVTGQIWKEKGKACAQSWVDGTWWHSMFRCLRTHIKKTGVSGDTNKQYSAVEGFLHSVRLMAEFWAFAHVTRALGLGSTGTYFKVKPFSWFYFPLYMDNTALGFCKNSSYSVSRSKPLNQLCESPIKVR